MNGFKKFCWWLNGFLSSFLLVGGAAAIVVFAIPAGVFVQNNEDYLDKELQNKNLFTLLTELQTIEIGQVPILKNALRDFFDQNDLGRYVSIDWDKFDHIAFGDVDGLQNALSESIEVVATLDSLDLVSSLQDFGKLPVIQSFAPLSETEQGALDVTAPDFIPELYYYPTASSSFGYAKAFDANRQLVEGAKGQTLYFPALKHVNLLDLFKVLPVRFGQEKIRNVVELSAPIEQGALIDLVLKDYAINEIGAIQPEDLTNDIKLSAVFPVEGNESFYDVIVGALAYEGNPEDIVIADLNGNLDLQRVVLSTVLDLQDEKLKSMLVEAIGKPYEEILIGDLATGFSLDSVRLETVMGRSDEKLASFLEQATGKPFSAIAIGDLSGAAFNVDNVKLTSFLPESESNKALYDCLRDALGVNSNADITLGALNGNFDLNSIKLSTLMPASPSPIINALIERGVTIGSIGSTIDQLSLYEIYGKNSFSPKASVSLTGDTYKAVSDPASGKITSYVYDPSLVDDPNNDADGVYYLSGNSSVWSLLCYDTTSSDPNNGRGLVYVVNDKTFKDLEGNVAGKALQEATIYELIATGLLDAGNYSDRVKAMSVKQILDAVAMIP